MAVLFASGEEIMPVQYQIKLYGSFDVIDSSGISCAPSSRKGCALLSLLASAANYKRSRAWLMATLWGRSSEQQAAASLRNCVYDLRKHFDQSNCFIHSDRSNLWLDSRIELFEVKGYAQDEFLEGLDIDEEGFEDWLRRQRFKRDLLVAEPKNFPIPQESLTPNYEQPHVVVLPVNSGSVEGRLIGDTVVDVIVRTITQHQCFGVLDLREGLDVQVHARMKLPHLGLVLRLFRTGEEYNISILLKRMDDGKVVWTGWYSESVSLSFAARPDRFRFFASKVANEVYDKIFEASQSGEMANIYGAIHNVLTHSRSGQVDARRILKDMVKDSGIARAWLMYTFAVAHAEQHGGLEPDALEELNEHCILANSKSPDNPIVQAIIGHIYAFVFRHPELAEPHHDIARTIGWCHPIVWTLSAMHEIYACRPDKAYEYSKRAISLSSYSPYHFFYQGPHSISCSLTGRHLEAIVVGKQVLDKKPMFLAAMRHMAASQIVIGEIDNARDTVNRIRSRDQRFLVGEIASDDYPLPSANSVEFIEHALTLADMKSPSANI